MALEAGTQLAGYEITGILGQGGMGVVYEATQLSLNRTVALKVLASHLGDDILFRERFVREGQIQAGIEHSHIVTVYEAGTSDHGFFIAMRLIRGPEPQGHDRVARARPGSHAADPHPDRRRARRGARRGADPPRHQAAEHPRGRARPGLPGRLRPDEGLGREEPDEDRPVRGHVRLHLARADQGREGHHAQRRLRARRRALRVPCPGWCRSRRTPRPRCCTRTWPRIRPRSPTRAPSCPPRSTR